MFVGTWGSDNQKNPESMYFILSVRLNEAAQKWILEIGNKQLCWAIICHQYCIY